MRLLAAVPLSIAVTVAATSAAQQATPDIEKRYVSIVASVLDRNGAVVPNLQKQDFTVLDNGKLQEIVLFQTAPRPFTVVVLLDFSRSMSSSWLAMRAAAEQFVAGLLPEDAGQVGAFSDEVHFVGRLTNEPTALIRDLSALPTGNPSRFHDALDASVDLLESVRGHKVVLVFTDGEDTASSRRFDDVLAKARTAGVMIYPVGVRSDSVNGVRRVQTVAARVLRRFADETGGRFFELKKSTDIGSSVARLAHELRHVYTIGFTPSTLDGKNHKLEVRVKRGLTVRARRGYMASPDRLSEVLPPD
jgi:VWFA-related protein